MSMCRRRIASMFDIRDNQVKNSSNIIKYDKRLERNFGKEHIMIKNDGIIMSLFLVLILQLLYVAGFKIFSLIGIFTLTVIYSGITGGIRESLISAGIGTIYSVYYMFSLGNSFRNINHHYLYAFTNDAILFIIAIYVGVWYRSKKQEFDKLRESQERLSHAESASIVITSYVDLSGKILKVTPKLCDLLEYSERELLELNIRDVTHPEDLDIDKDKYEMLINNKTKSYDIEKRCITKSGKIIWVYVSRALVRDRKGKPLYLLTYVRDISKPKLMEEMLKNSYEFNQAVIDSVPTYITVVDHSGNVTTINDKSREYKCSDNCPFNLKPGENYFDITGKLCGKCSPKTMEVFKGVKKVLSRETEQYNVEYSCGAYAEKKWYLVYITPLRNIKQGAVISQIDITKRKVMEAELIESKNQYRKLIEFLPESTLVSCEEEIVFANPTAIRTLGLSNSKDLSRIKAQDIIHPDCKKLYIQTVNEVNDEKKELPPIEKKVVKLDGSIIDMEVVSTYFPYKGKPAVLTVGRDITERKMAEKLQRDMEEKLKQLREALEYDKIKTEFFANISHELRTPLNVLIGSLQLMDMQVRNNLIIDRDNRMGKHFKTMKQNCFRLLRLVNNLIDITKIDSGFYEIHLKNMDIVNIIEEITLSVAEYVENNEITLVFDTDVEEKVMAFDPDKIERIILNLLSNAIKFTGAGGTITVTLSDKEESISISVKDTGMGIPHDKLEIIFERFRQVNKSLTRNHEGSGIGLSLVKSLVEMHNGKISVNSERGIGSEFTIDLPANLVAQDDVNIKSNYEQSRIERVNLEFSDIYS
jgi:PAS domain S-box-containing protein